MIPLKPIPVGVLRQRGISSMQEGAVYASCYKRFQIEGHHETFDIAVEQVDRFGLLALVGKRVSIEHEWSDFHGVIVTKVTEIQAQ
ncbi:MAG: hypothetical protein RIQ41_92 [Candidatus Parcubacteria bacterium]|jgi:hypothetical protein